MSRLFAPLAVLVFATVSVAAPREKGPSREAVAAGEQFARQIGAAAGIVSREYVRAVETADLYAAAVAGLFDAGRRPRPDVLLRDLKAAKSEHERIHLLARARAEVHGAPELADGRDLVVAVSAFTTVLDPHTTLRPNAEVNGTATALAYGFDFDGEAQARRLTRTHAGALVFAERDDAAVSGVPPLPFRIGTVKPGSPAQKAGLRPGDLVRQIDGVPADARSAAQAFAALYGAGPASTGVHELVVERAGQTGPFRLRLERGDFMPESLFGVRRTPENTWDYWLDRNHRIAYVRVGPIENETGNQLSEILHNLEDVRGLILDLRWCPGGYVDPAVQIASIFLESGQIARTKYRNPRNGEGGELRADSGLVRYRAGDYPVLVLVNGETTGGGELIAAALKDNGRAVVAGTRTFGKASIQWTMSIQGLPGYQFKLTGGTYSRPNGKNLQRFPDSKPSDDWGVRPDPGYELPTSADLARKLQELHQLYALRPGGSREAMELDDPAADPQRLRALKLMRSLIEKK